MDNGPDELKEKIKNVTFSNDADGIYYGLKNINLVD
jgi:hydroxymethylpyrimidine pyrophosphatase-like HAD family hydrolase